MSHPVFKIPMAAAEQEAASMVKSAMPADGASWLAIGDLAAGIVAQARERSRGETPPAIPHALAA